VWADLSILCQPLSGFVRIDCSREMHATIVGPRGFRHLDGLTFSHSPLRTHMSSFLRQIARFLGCCWSSTDWPPGRAADEIGWWEPIPAGHARIDTAPIRSMAVAGVFSGVPIGGSKGPALHLFSFPFSTASPGMLPES
jgi:hypothetical protein